MKSVFVPDQWVTGKPEEYVQGLRRKYGVTDEDGVKGTGQLARFIAAIGASKCRPAELEGIRRVIPVLLVYDPLLDAPLHAEFLAREFMMALSPDEILPNGNMKKGGLWVAGLVIMTIDVLENLESSVKEVSLMQLLSSYSTDVPNRDVSLHNYIAFSPVFSKHIWSSERLRQEFSRESERVNRRLGLSPDEGW